MKKLKNSLMAFCIGATAMGSLSVIGSDAKTVLINVNKNNDENAVVDIKIDGETDMFNLPDLQEGESKTFTSSSGKTIVTTKTAEGYIVEVDGKEINIPIFVGKLGAKLHKSMPIHQVKENVINVSGADLDETQQQIIKDAFLAAGIEKEVRFNKHKVMVFSTGKEFKLDGNGHALEWIAKDGDFDIKIDGEDGNKVLHKVIRIETTDEEN